METLEKIKQIKIEISRFQSILKDVETKATVNLYEQNKWNKNIMKIKE